MQLVVGITLAWIALVDLRSHRIPNRALAVLTLLSVIYSARNGFIWVDQILVAFILLIAGIGLWRFLNLGMGDVKLIFAMALLLIPATFDSYYRFMTLFSMIALLHLLAQALIFRSFSKPLPLAPSLVLAYIFLLYLK
jgi:Flp pilus assembly protein protease CpaA